LRSGKNLKKDTYDFKGRRYRKDRLSKVRVKLMAEVGGTCEKKKN